MRVEIPECKRCCCCIPLRYGLLVGAYIRIAYFLFLIILSASILYSVIMHPQWYSLTNIIFQSIFLIWLVLDVLFNVVLVVGGHTKNAKLLKYQFYCGVGSLVMYVVICIAATVNMMIQHFQFFYFYRHSVVIMISVLCIYGIGIVIQTYLLLLTSSEVKKLTSNVEFRFVNNAPEAQCVVEMADKSVVNDTAEYEGEQTESIHIERDENDSS